MTRARRRHACLFHQAVDVVVVGRCSVECNDSYNHAHTQIRGGFARVRGGFARIREDSRIIREPVRDQLREDSRTDSRRVRESSREFSTSSRELAHNTPIREDSRGFARIREKFASKFARIREKFATDTQVRGSSSRGFARIRGRLTTVLRR